MANVLKREKQFEICALGRLGWSLRRIQEATGVRRETIGQYLKAAGIETRAPRGRRLDPPRSTDESEPGSKPASQVTADPDPAHTPVSGSSYSAKPP